MRGMLISKRIFSERRQDSVHQVEPIIAIILNPNDYEKKQ